MQEVQLYIEGVNVDFFKDESISLTSTIKDVRDFSKVFTDFSKSFTLPASKTNNKLFKHYYNSDIDGFDARTKKDANIELNYLPFREGKIKLNGVKMKNNKPYAYDITFFGSTVTLKDLLGDDSLSALSNGLSTHDTIYDPSTIQSGLALDPASNDVIVPLITHTKRLIYDSSSGHVHDTTTEGNLYYKGSSGHIHGVEWNDLKYAIRLDTIIRAIETTYGITFSSDFFTSSNAPYYNLFMWLHRKKGAVESPSGINQSPVNGFPNLSDYSLTHTAMSSNVLSIFGTVVKYLAVDLTFLTTSAETYIVSLQRNGLEVYNSGSVSGDLYITKSDFTLGQGDYTILISAGADITFSNILWEIEYKESSALIYNKTYETSTYNHVNAFDFIITQQIPEIKVIDFLTSIFKTFNLTAYVEKNTGVVIVKTLDNFYSGGLSHDISKFIQVDTSSVNVALPYRKINFGYEDTETFLAKVHSQLFGKEWAKIEYTNDENLDGGIYDIKTAFSHLKYERLLNINGGASTDAQYGYFVDDNQESYFGKPLLFYPIKQTSATAISFMPSETSHVSLTSYNIPSNSLSLVAATSKVNINFFNEINEYASVDPNSFTDTLFEVYYKDYITNIFNKSNRITKVTAYLPLKILLNYTLADRFILNGKSYKINSVKTELQSGKSKIELLNDIS